MSDTKARSLKQSLLITLVGCANSFAHADVGSVVRPLIVVATEVDAVAAVRRLQSLEPVVRAPLITVASENCLNLKAGLFLVVVKDPAVSLAMAKQKIPDSYARSCRSKVLAPHLKGETEIDQSFSALTVPPVNWGGGQMLARIVGPNDGHAAVLLNPYFNNIENDPNEGLRYAIRLLRPNRLGVDLVRDCIDAQVSSNRSYVAVACATEQVVEQPIFQTRVFKIGTEALVATFDRCAAPKLIASSRKLVCAEQSISSQGQVLESSKVRVF